MSRDYSIDLKKIHFRTVSLRYTDPERSFEIFLEESAVPEFDWIGSEKDIPVDGDVLETILERVSEWASHAETRIKLCKIHELGL